MDALLILSGICLVCAGWIWLVVQSRHLSIGLVLLALTFPFVAVLMRDRGYPLLPRLALCLGFLAAVSGLGLLHQLHPDRFAALVSGEWRETSESSLALRGEVAGQSFQPQRAFWHGDELVFEEARGNQVRRSLAIRFTSAPSLLVSPSIERIPTDPGEWPQVRLRWYQGALTDSGVRVVPGEYSLDLDLNPQSNGTTTLEIQLHLPAAQKTWLVGTAALEETPAWLATLASRDVTFKKPAVTEAVLPTAAVEPKLAAWHPLSVLTVVEEPDLYRGKRLRLTTLAGRVHEGRLQDVSPDKRLVISQVHGPNRVELQFRPVDLRMIEGFYAPR
ncbi:hypothetical protein HG264_03015 [Pseudomonas sp. gcc21]|uniref:hypothetical protein n=1 Tax=Pseudomonas sp. gcc21 TaxID=2726989 RepID=UPI0014522335|nr:hypothetical protein [Pseudomonas sp. gcc21]QJD57946.1 hypothetical protein HG264_03015 [Pseudomonas sp. gcc21]